MMRAAFIAVVGSIFLTACTTPEEARKQSFRGMQGKDEIHEVVAQHWPTALWSQSKLESWIKRDASKVCPQGYRELSRTPGKNYVDYSGPISMPYQDIHVRIACPASAAVPA